jgi:predicted DNA-binding protein (MmcQ/YjbR family)
MDNERIREICLAMPHVTETVNWGHHLVYWAGDRDIGGKMFAMTDLDGTGIGVLWFHCGAERFHELLERDGIRASPYLAKAHWVTLERWGALRPREIEDELKRAHALIFEKLPPKTKAILALPEKDRAKAIRERKKTLTAKAEAPSRPPKSSSAMTPTRAAKARPPSLPASTRPARTRPQKAR